MPDLPKVILLLETSLEYGRGLMRGVSRYARLHGPWSLLVEPGHFEHVLPLIDPSEQCGVIARITSVADADAIEKAACPTVVLEPSFDNPALAGGRRGFHEIRSDSPAIARIAADHLTGLGLTRFAYCGYACCPWSERRQEEFVSHLAARGFLCSIFPSPSPIGHEHDHGQLHAWLQSLPTPTGLMACNDMCGRQVMNACAEVGIAVPDELAVVGVDNDQLICELTNPPMSSVVLDLKQAGYAAAELLDALMSGRGPDARQILPVRAVKVEARRSSEPIIEDHAQVAAALRFIRDHVVRLSGVPEVSEHVGVSRRTLERSFNQVLGHGVYEEITRSRLLRAKCLLEETDLPACRVAESAGFNGIQPMMRLFRQREDCTPLEYRRQHGRSNRPPPVTS